MKTLSRNRPRPLTSLVLQIAGAKRTLEASGLATLNVAPIPHRT
jgi:hypothetical protein